MQVTLLLAAAISLALLVSITTAQQSPPENIGNLAGVALGTGVLNRLWTLASTNGVLATLAGPNDLSK
jgi:hypothetical protein